MMGWEFSLAITWTWQQRHFWGLRVYQFMAGLQGTQLLDLVSGSHSRRDGGIVLSHSH